MAGIPLPIKPDSLSLVKVLRDPAASNKNHAIRDDSREDSHRNIAPE